MAGLYHVTFLHNLDSIAANGLLPGERSQFTAAYTAHSRGKLFLTDFDGVSFWMSKLEDIANANSDFNEEDDAGWVPVVLRIDPDIFEDDDLHPDVLGTRDSPGDAWFVTFPVEPEYIEVWDGRRWRPVDEVDTEAMQARALRAGTFERDDPDEDADEDPTGYWVLDFDVFAPEAP